MGKSVLKKFTGRAVSCERHFIKIFLKLSHIAVMVHCMYKLIYYVLNRIRIKYVM